MKIDKILNTVSDLLFFTAMTSVLLTITIAVPTVAYLLIKML